MKKQAGLWIDHRQAIVVHLLDPGEKITHIESHLDKRVRFSGASETKGTSGHNDSAEDKRDRRFNDRVKRYYDEVITNLLHTDDIVLFGPGEAKNEFQKHLETQNPSIHIVAIESADKMTVAQVAAEIRKYYEKSY